MGCSRPTKLRGSSLLCRLYQPPLSSHSTPKLDPHFPRSINCGAEHTTMGFPFFPTISTKSHKKRDGSSKKDRKKPSKPHRPEHNTSFGSASSSSSSSSSSSLDSPTSVLRRPLADLTRISCAELEVALRGLGACEGSEIAAVLAEADRDGDGWISVEELLQGSTSCRGVDEEVADDGSLREAFSVYDLDGDGRISAEELLRVLAVLGDRDCSLDDCRRMIGVVDSDGDGFVGFDDFARMMTVAVDAWAVATPGAVLSQ